MILSHFRMHRAGIRDSLVDLDMQWRHPFPFTASLTGSAWAVSPTSADDRADAAPNIIRIRTKRTIHTKIVLLLGLGKRFADGTGFTNPSLPSQLARRSE